MRCTVGPLLALNLGESARLRRDTTEGATPAMTASPVLCICSVKTAGLTRVDTPVSYNTHEKHVVLRFTNVYGDQNLTSEPIARSMSLLMICVFPNNEVITNLDIVISFHRREHF